jgi:large subunit ribosomal protein L10
MRREQKNALVEELKETVENYSNFYLTDATGLDAKETAELRRKCFESEISLKVVKNTLLKLALDRAEGNYDELYNVLVNNTAVMFCNTANAPGKLIKKLNSSKDKPSLKAAYIDGSVYIGEENLEVLANLKSREELIGDVILLLQSPMKTVLGQLESGKNILAGVVKTLSERE